MPDAFPRVHRPCNECPFRRDTPPGQFPAERFEQLRNTAGSPGREVPLGGPMFACHKTPDDAPRACAGWLAVSGRDHVQVRMAVITGRLEPDACEPGPGWPQLFRSYDEMAATQGGGDRA